MRTGNIVEFFMEVLLVILASYGIQHIVSLVLQAVAGQGCP